MIDIFHGSGRPLTPQGFDAAAAKAGVTNDRAALWAVLSVETKGFGYLPDRRPKILFERHVFHKRTRGQFSAANPDISNPHTGGYLGGAAEYQRLKKAMLLDRRAALESASWGLGQVMGFNAASLGYTDVDAMVAAFRDTEDAQLDGCARFITATPALQKALATNTWDRVAFFYNGRDYAKNAYGTKLAAAHALRRTNEPDIGLRNAQALLTYLGLDPRGIDGLEGQNTTNAIAAFQRSYVPPNGGKKLPLDGSLDRDTQAALAQSTGVSS